MKKLKNLTIDEEFEIFNQRKNGLKRSDIILNWGISERHYKNIILKFGGKLKNKTKQYSFNECYFENINTEDKAYFLGFIIADGNIHSNNNSIKMFQKETDILYEFKNYIQSSCNIFSSKLKNISSITISSKKNER